MQNRADEETAGMGARVDTESLESPELGNCSGHWTYSFLSADFNLKQRKKPPVLPQK